MYQIHGLGQASFVEQPDTPESLRYRFQQLIRNYIIELQKILTAKGFSTPVTAMLDDLTVRNANAWFASRGYVPPIDNAVRAQLLDPRPPFLIRWLFQAVQGESPEPFTHQKLPAGATAVALRGSAGPMEWDALYLGAPIGQGYPWTVSVPDTVAYLGAAAPPAKVPSIVEQIKAAQAKQIAARTKTLPKGAKDPKVLALQKALRAAGLTDADHLPIVADGVFGKRTLEAVNKWLISRGRTPTTAVDIRQNIEEITLAIADVSVPLAAKTAKPDAARRPVGVAAAAPRVGVIAGDFTCTTKLCRAKTLEAKAKAINLQKLLNQFPQAIITLYKDSRRVAADGIIGPATVEAVKAVLKVAAARQGLQLSQAELSALTLENVAIATSAEEIHKKINAELIEQRKLSAVGGKLADESVWRVDKKGNIVGNNHFRCLVMALQVQLNRWDQQLKVEGVIGPNTIASVAAVVGGTWTKAMVAENLMPLIDRVRKLAEEKNMPPPRIEAGGKAFSKCVLETTQPVTDARVTPEGQTVPGPTVPPAPRATATEDQPPIPPPVVTSPRVAVAATAAAGGGPVEQAEAAEAARAAAAAVRPTLPPPPAVPPEPGPVGVETVPAPEMPQEVAPAPEEVPPVEEAPAPMSRGTKIAVAAAIGITLAGGLTAAVLLSSRPKARPAARRRRRYA
jgi:lysozyme family protein